MRKIGILLYHRVEYLEDDYNMQAVAPDNFEKHMRYLHNHYDVLDLNTPMQNWFNSGTRNAVIVTFDDGYYDFLYNAVPVLEKYHIPATIFIATENIDSGNENWTDNILRIIFSNNSQKDFFIFNNEFYRGKLPTRNYKEKYDFYQLVRKLFLISSAEERKKYEEELLKWAGVPRSGRKDRRIMTAEEIRKTAKKPGISIGAHTVTHASLKCLSKSEARLEILESKRNLEKIIGKEVKLFSYPFGTRNEYSDITIDVVKEVGLEKAVVAYPGNISINTNPFELNRFAIANYSERDFSDYIQNYVFGDGKVDESERSCLNTPIKYIGKLEEDYIVLNTDSPLVIWGTGYWGRKLYAELIMLKMDSRIIAFGDNDESKFEHEMEGIPIKSAKEIKDMQYKYPCHILVKGKYDLEICKRLFREQVENIHLIL